MHQGIVPNGRKSFLRQTNPGIIGPPLDGKEFSEGQPVLLEEKRRVRSLCEFPVNGG